ncbi:endonuclease/exonuclease/phosphatase family protein [Yoonia litorea]|uniref:endonuclease/exonuclease/phosphatase family protein n=1 Tax=Yoonia litorea TaxID=1123755 RepID=UPI001F611536|nr:endonuclease/exonuclease/phosphatase family protein [Yoonia litorea]
MRDIRRGQDPQIAAIKAVIATISPDILVLTDFDYDHDGLALSAFAETTGLDYTHRFSRLPNAGQPSGFDIDGNGRTGDARDSLGYGRFTGDGGVAVLSRYPFNQDGFVDHTAMLWRDLPDAQLPMAEGRPFLSDEVLKVLPLSSTVHWNLPVVVPQGQLRLLVFAATPPVFDGPEDMNGHRARDELRLWENVLDGQMGAIPEAFVVVGNANLDPLAGDGDRAAMATFLRRQDLSDPHPGQPNADWGTDGPGQLRVSYVLPSSDWQVVGAGTFWPDADMSEADSLSDQWDAVGPHRLVWVDISR